MTDRQTKNVRLFVAMTFTVIYFLLLYLNYNLPVFKQISAHYFYVPVTLETKVDAPKSQIYVHPPAMMLSTIYDRNKTIFGKITDLEPYKYQVNEETYNVSHSSYVITSLCDPKSSEVYGAPIFLYWPFQDNRSAVERFPKRVSEITKKNFLCDPKIDEVFYNPIYPAWSVLNNAMPYQTVIWEGFILTTKGLIILISLYIAAAFLLLKNLMKGGRIKNIIQADKSANLLIFAMAYPFLAKAFLHLFSVFHALNGLIRNLDHQNHQFYAEILGLAILILPNILIFAASIKGTRGIKDVYAAFVVFLIWNLQDVFVRLFLICVTILYNFV